NGTGGTQVTNTQGGGTLGIQGSITIAAGGASIILDGGTLNNISGTNTYAANVVIGSNPITLLPGYGPPAPVVSATINAAAGTLNVTGGIDDQTAARTINKTGGGTVTLSGPAVSLVNGTVVNVNAGTLNSNNATALGTLAATNVAAGATLGV